ncbi:PREDICTED: probable receptor-like protein kinase At2g47060 isoform X2 [Camelina sativa]|uniref:non-specific serine/threonine protein kinase n=1 Tax=Camelina sativa TaxID=90675 RepID=A0ABM0W6I2_CAMSA|nr:PREDICTED: probable receptor-like protein kinase At2g47060 isoform X2 [Camelina sativa]
MMLKLNTTMIAAAFEIIAIICALFWIYRVLCYDNKISRKDSTITREVVMPECVIEFPLEEMMPEGLIKFTSEEVRQATNDYDEDNLIGFGCYGLVYSGLIGDMPVVIKTGIGYYRHPTFLAEVSYMSSKTQHNNVVNLVGYCYNDGEYEVLVYEYLINGNVQDYLREHADLTFKQRVSIALGAARGLQHLHNLNPPLQHKRFTTNKVLLDANLNAKVSDAGMSGFVQELPVVPLFFDNDKGGSEETVDVYSFGMFLLELFTGEEPEEFKSNLDLVIWIVERVYSDTMNDERMTGTFKKHSLMSLMLIMVKCMKYPPAIRVNMDGVVRELEEIVQIEEGPLHTIAP